MNKPTISIIAITWNESEGLSEQLLDRHRRRLEVCEKSLFSLRRNAGYPFEFIVVSSGDKRHNDRVEKWKKEIPIDKCIYLDKPIGVTPVRAMAYKKTTGRWIGFFDDDMVGQPDWLLNNVRFAKKMLITDRSLYLSAYPGPESKWKEETEGYIVTTKPHDGAMIISREIYEKSIGYEGVIDTPFLWERLMKSIRSFCRVAYTPKPLTVQCLGVNDLRKLWAPEWYLKKDASFC